RAWEKRRKDDIVTENLNEYLESNLSSRTVKDHFVLLVDDFEKTDAASRRKSGVAEDFDIYHQLLTDITCQIKDGKATKHAKKDEKKAKADRLETLGEKFRDEACRRPSKRMKQNIDSDESASEDLNGHSKSKANNDKPVNSGKTLPVTLTTTQVNSAIAEYLEYQMRTHEEMQKVKQKEIELEAHKAAKEEDRWHRDFELRQAQIDLADRKGAAEVALRREEMQLRREELKLLNLQMEYISRRAGLDNK
ncbi:unnamed protein product, partial [Aphanomyces euteiches]